MGLESLLTHAKEVAVSLRRSFVAIDDLDAGQ